MPFSSYISFSLKKEGGNKTKSFSMVLNFESMLILYTSKNKIKTVRMGP